MLTAKQRTILSVLRQQSDGYLTGVPASAFAAASVNHLTLDDDLAALGDAGYVAQLEGGWTITDDGRTALRDAG
jgi:hypothetical protein